MFSAMHFMASNLPGVIPFRIWSEKCASTAADSSFDQGILTDVLDLTLADATRKEIQNKFNSERKSALIVSLICSSQELN